MNTFFWIAGLVFGFGIGCWSGYALASRESAALWKHGYNLGVSNTARGLSKARQSISILISKRRHGRVAA